MYNTRDGFSCLAQSAEAPVCAFGEQPYKAFCRNNIHNFFEHYSIVFEAFKSITLTENGQNFQGMENGNQRFLFVEVGTGKPRIYKNNDFEKLKDLGNEKEEKKKEQQYMDNNGKPLWSKEKPNPDNINLIINIDIKIKGINLNLYPFIASKDSTEFINIKIKNLDSKIFLNNDKFELNFNVKDVIFGPSKLNSGEKVIISNNSIKRRKSSNNFNNGNCFKRRR